MSVPGIAATYFVAPDGSDRNNGSEEQPWRSLQRAADKVSAGDTVLVADGEYAPFHLDTSGKPDRRIEIKSRGNNAIIKGYGHFDDRLVAVSVLASYVTIEGFQIEVSPTPISNQSRGIRVSGIHGRHARGVTIRRNKIARAGWVGITTSYADDVVIEQNEVWGSHREHGIYVANSGDRPVVRANIVHDNGEAGIQLNADPDLPGDAIISGAIVEGNIVYRNGKRGSAAINLASVRDSRIVNNLLYDNYSQGIASWDDDAGEKFGCKNNQYLHNTVVMPVGAYHALVLRHGSTNNVVKNNILLHLGERDGFASDASSMVGLVSDHNLMTHVEDNDRQLIPLREWQTRRGQDRHSLTATAQEVFANLEQADYRLAARSPAIDRGDAVDSVAHDLPGTARPQGKAPDIGAYELTAQTARTP